MHSWVPLRHFRIGIVHGFNAARFTGWTLNMNTNNQETSPCTLPFV
ncbi:hypothetical protein SAMN05216359_11181 [Roseateles sp. YR242]|nr:hypothetical protein SAMN05216359_11181 [Roseateles sp. YR242]